MNIGYEETKQQEPPPILQTKWGLFPITVLIFSTVFLLSSTTSLERSYAEEIYSTYYSTIEKVNFENPFEIFINNFSLSLVMMIPVIGFAFSLFTSSINGIIISAISLIENLNPLSVAVWLISKPFGILEFLAYGLASAQSLTFFFAIVGKRTRRELKGYISTILIVAGLLIVAAFLETVFLTGFVE